MITRTKAILLDGPSNCPGDATAQNIKDWNTAIKWLKQPPEFRKIYAEIDGSDTQWDVHFVNDHNGECHAVQYEIDWNPAMGSKVVTYPHGVRHVTNRADNPSFILAHELDHAYRWDVNAPESMHETKLPPGGPFENTEERAVVLGFETLLGHELHQPTRNNHDGEPIDVHGGPLSTR